MEIIDDLAKASLRQQTVLTIGAFDGVHVGHQALIAQVVDRARVTDRLAAVMTFHPHPAEVLAPERAPGYLTTLGEKVALLEVLGVDLLVLLAFNRDVAQTSAREFMEAACLHLRIRELWVGADFALGRAREGDPVRLRELGEMLGYQVHVVNPVESDQGVISSSRVRALLREGRVRDAAQLLGRYPSLSGEVVLGAQRGRTLGFPTANLEVRPERVVPADGVYAAFALLGSQRHAAVANVGVRPSFDNGHRTVETHLFDFDRDIYGCDLVVEFVARLRNERRFEDVDDLVAQIGRDSESARQILGQEDLGADISGAPVIAGRMPNAACRHRYREIAHTADRALWVWGESLPDLFVGAARGMFSMMADTNDLVATEQREVRLQALDAETLLVDWLNELLYLTESTGLLFGSWSVDSLAFAPTAVSQPSGQPAAGSGSATLVARAGGAPGDVTGAHIKAATFHDLALVRGDQGWSTIVTFDV
jgi:riboflavin kinase/FMN adenylyltransferase